MNRARRLEEFLLCRGGSATLGEIINEGHPSFSYKVTAAVSDLRKQLSPFLKTVKCCPGETPSKNRYSIANISGPLPVSAEIQTEVLSLPSAPNLRKPDSDGQYRLGLM